MKLAVFFFGLLLISCDSIEKKAKSNDQIKLVSNKISAKDKWFAAKELALKETQDSLRVLLLNSKPNNNLKSSILQELYLKGLVNQVGDTYLFKLPFNLHSFDCGAPDCYSTDITFSIPVEKPIKFPKAIYFHLFEHGCVDQETAIKGAFRLTEQATEYVNYYSKKQKSNLVILIKKRQLYYFTDTSPNTIKINQIDKIISQYNDDNPDAIVPYQSTIMLTNEYESFMKNK